MTEEEEWQKEIEDFFNQLKNEAQADLDEIKKWQTLATSICIGCIAGSLIDYLVKPNIIIITGALIIGLSMGLCAIGFYLIRRSIIKQIKREVTAETDDIYDSVERLFGDLDELVEQIETTEMDDDLVLLQKRDLLISFAQEVGYPRYENDVNLTNQIIDNHFFKKYPPEQTTILIKNMEQLMLDKAYKFYTGRLGRKRHLRGKLL